MGSASDLAYGAVVLVGDHNWRRGPKLAAALAFLLGRRQRFEHLGMRCLVAWRKEKPYLISIREAA